MMQTKHSSFKLGFIGLCLPMLVLAYAQSSANQSSVIEPEMVKIQAGTFKMGCVETRDLTEAMTECSPSALPAHNVDVKAFAMGKYEVTFAEWDACEQANACPHAEDEGWGRNLNPVINVSWRTTQTYIEWLNAQTGKHYRLPTEAEWEYAARAGKNSAYPWGTNQISCGSARYWNEGCEKFRSTTKVGSYAANGFGLYDMAGNVWEWVQDFYTDNYQANTKPISHHVIRGGGWSDEALLLGSLIRYERSSGDTTTGFRLALDQP